jgi:hypothetical protein
MIVPRWTTGADRNSALGATALGFLDNPWRKKSMSDRHRRSLISRILIRLFRLLGVAAATVVLFVITAPRVGGQTPAQPS